MADIPNPDRPRGLFVAFCAGLAMMTLGLIAGFAASGPESGSIGLALLVALFSLPFWVVGAFVLGGPIWVLAERCGLHGPRMAALVGAVVVGGIWLAYLGPMATEGDYEAWTWILGASLIGAMSGAAAGLGAWWGGYRWGQPK